MVQIVPRLALVVGLAGMVPLAAGGQDAAAPPRPPLESDAERALEAVRRGEILRLSEILTRIEDQFDGRAIETEIETEDGRWIYELEILTTDGRLIEVDVDAVTGEIVEVEEEVD